ncbi:MAG: hypothetical protein RH946_09985 [Rhodospirillales bacterium]|tara:strand:+ start:714 stop:1208 length:495 start_codon:yes stop_codon:yes gene_type:complete
MNLDTVATIANIMASGAVVLTLVFIGLQLRQNSQLTRMAAAQTSAQLLSTNLGRIAESAELAELIVREKGRESWTPVEFLRVSNFLSISFRHFEVLHTHRRYGVFEDELWEGSEARLRESLSNPGIRDWWAESRPLYARSFAKYVDTLAAELDAAQAMAAMDQD